MLNMSAVGMKVHLTEEQVACLFTPEHACGQSCPMLLLHIRILFLYFKQ